MRKSDKKIERAIGQALSQACDFARDNIAGFTWLTHHVDYQNFPKSLIIVCVFDSAQQQTALQLSPYLQILQQFIKMQLQAIAIQPFNVATQLFFDNEEACYAQHQGNWAQRLKHKH
jgi:hypothetical protein